MDRAEKEIRKSGLYPMGGYARIALERLFAAGVLTEVQKRRFRLHVFRGLSTRQIGRLEGTSHQAVAKSLNLAIEKLKKFFAEQG